MPGTPSPSPAAISFGPKRVEQRHEQTFIEKSVIGVLVLTVVAAIGVFGYRYYLQTKLTDIQSQIADAEDDYTIETYDSIRAFDREVRAARFMLGNRLDHRRIFAALENTVSRSVFYQSFESTINESGDVVLTLGGISPEFAQIVLQTDSLFKQSLLTNIKLSRIEVRKTTGVDDTEFGASAIIPRMQLVRDVSQSQTSTEPVTAPPAASASSNLGAVGTSTATTSSTLVQ